MPAHIGLPSYPVTLASPSRSYHLSAPSTPQHRIPQSPAGHYQPQEEPFPSTSQIILTQHIPTLEEAISRLKVDQIKNTGPPFFVVFNGQQPGVFTSWYVSSSLIVDRVFIIIRPFVMRSCKWKKGDWKKYQTSSAALEAYEEAYIHGGLKLNDTL